MEDKINLLLNGKNLDIRKSSYRFMDQKVTPDVLSFIADCIINYPDSLNKEFTKNDIWHSEYFTKNVSLIYNKPSANNITTEHEYDKFTAQPLKTLAYSGILKEEKRFGVNHYRVIEKNILEYISLNDRNAFAFLYSYITKVLNDSGFWNKVLKYIQLCKNVKKPDLAYYQLKKSFIKFLIGNTKIKKVIEVRRIYPKVINIIAVNNAVPGSRGGHVTNGPYLYSDLMYNATNFRDIYKNKGVSRQEARVIIKSAKYNNYEVIKAVNAIKNKYFPDSEVRDRFANGTATQVHHIFPKESYPELSSTLENLILLTAQQHNTKAHPNNNTQTIDPSYQIDCLISKSLSVEKSVKNKDGFYTKRSYLGVLKQGLGLDISDKSSFSNIREKIRNYHKKD